MDYPLTQPGATVQELLDSISTLSEQVEVLEGLPAALEDETHAREAADEAQDAVIGILQKGLGSSQTVDTIALSKAIDDKAVSYSTQKLITKSGYGVSDTLHLERGKIYLFPVSGVNASDTAYLSQSVTRTYEKAIVYAYTYKEVNDRRVIDTATADYDETLVYTYGYDADGNLITILDKNGDPVPGMTLPGTREVTESFYSVLVHQPVITGGKFLYVPTFDMDVVVSHTSANLTGDVEVLDFQLVIGLVESLMGAVQEAVICEVFGSITKRIEGIEHFMSNMGKVSVAGIDSGAVPTVCGQKMIIIGTEAPDVYPGFAGQIWYDRIGAHLYLASGTASSSNWQLIV